MKLWRSFLFQPRLTDGWYWYSTNFGNAFMPRVYCCHCYSVDETISCQWNISSSSSTARRTTDCALEGSSKEWQGKEGLLIPNPNSRRSIGDIRSFTSMAVALDPLPHSTCLSRVITFEPTHYTDNHIRYCITIRVGRLNSVRYSR